MITAIALVCALDNPSNCYPIVKRGFSETEEECLSGLESATLHAKSLNMFVSGYRCVVWGEPT